MMSKRHTTQRQVTYKNLSEEEVQELLDLGYNPKETNSLMANLMLFVVCKPQRLAKC